MLQLHHHGLPPPDRSVRGARDGTAPSCPHPVHWSPSRALDGARDGAIQDLEEEATGSMPLELRLPTSPATRRWWGGTASTSGRREVAAWRGAGGDGCVCV